MDGAQRQALRRRESERRWSVRMDGVQRRVRRRRTEKTGGEGDGADI